MLFFVRLVYKYQDLVLWATGFVIFILFPSDLSFLSQPRLIFDSISLGCYND